MSRRAGPVKAVTSSFRHVLGAKAAKRPNPWPKCGSCFHRVPPPICAGCGRCQGCCERCDRCDRCLALCAGHQEVQR